VPLGYPGSNYLLLKLDSSGNIQWQKAYTGGQYCYYNGYSEQCYTLGGFIYSAHQTSDGGYLLTGDGNLVLSNGATDGMAPWMAKVDSSGNLVWQHFYYQVYKPTGLSLSEYFQSSALANNGGFIAIGYSENYANQHPLIFVVRTDSGGLCGAGCSDVHTATVLTAFNPALTVSSPSLPVSTTATPGVSSPATTQTTSALVTKDC